MNRYNAIIGERIKNIRKSKGITQSELAGAVGRSKNHISKIETGCANPPLSLLIEISEVLDIKLNDLFNQDNPPPDILENIDWNKKIKQIKEPQKKQYVLKMLNVMFEICADE